MSATQPPVSSVSNKCDDVYCQGEKNPPEIGVWNGNELDFSHLIDMPFFNITIDASISEKSNDILSWIHQRYVMFYYLFKKCTALARINSFFFCYAGRICSFT
jgi:hypothetical protein